MGIRVVPGLKDMKDVNYYLALPYTVILRRDEEGDFVARVDELPGCAAHGKTPQEALQNLEEAKTLWITDCIESGDLVPEPILEEVLPSGKWVQRVPKNLHMKLTSIAKREGVSLNQFVTSILAEAVGMRMAKERDKFPLEKGGEAPGKSAPVRNKQETLFQDVPEYFKVGDLEIGVDEFSKVYLVVSGREVFAQVSRRSGTVSLPVYEVPDKFRRYLH